MSTKNYFSTWPLVVSSAVVASLATYIFTTFTISTQDRKKNTSNATTRRKSNSDVNSNEDTSKSETEIETENITLGPDRAFETQFQLNLRGRVDRIYERHGPKPFEFNGEVVSVFDDMVSRSVPLYCEVIDLAIYWFEKYYKTGSRLYDLGCSTGTTIDILARSAKALASASITPTSKSASCGDGDSGGAQIAEFVGVDNSEAMVEACKEKLNWATKDDSLVKIDIRCGDILDTVIENASFVIMNYTLQFVPVLRRQQLLQSVATGLNEGGIFLLSEKVRVECSEMQETCTWIYEDFKERRKYTRREIARKKEALMNVLIPYTESELRNALNRAGFETVEVIAKWNNFLTIVARKRTSVATGAAAKLKVETLTPHLDALFDTSPVYLADYLEPKLLSQICLERHSYYRNKGGFGISADNLKKFDNIARVIQELPKLSTKKLIVDNPVLTMGDPTELTEEQMSTFQECIKLLMPWKKGPLNLFGTEIDTEWRSDWKWERLQKVLPDIDLEEKTVCDLGCGNGYFMYRMLEYDPKLVMGIDPNLHAWLEFNLFQRISGIEKLKFEYLRGDIMSSLPGMFDVVFCLGVLYHTPDPIGMLKDIHISMKGKSTLIVDCQGIDGEDHFALFPMKRYTNMKGVYFLPTMNTLKNWLQRANFKNIKVIFSEQLSTDEQRATKWAQVRSLQESLDQNDDLKTVEGYPRAHRFYVQCEK